MENYEQKHKEDLEAARGWLAIAKENDNKIAIQILENLFPELRESEDEKIRKAILLFFQTQDDNTTYSFIPKKDIISWLEKQGENNPYSGTSFEYNGHTWGMCAREGGVDILCDSQLIKHIEKQGEQPSWSEEDEEILKLSLENLTELKNNFGEKYGKVGDCIKWLKSIKPNHWKPSEEQMQALNWIAYNYALMDKGTEENLQSLYNDLKNL